MCSIKIDLFIRGRKLNISLIFIKNIRKNITKNILHNCTHCLIMKIPNKQELRKIEFNYSSDLDFEDFMNFYNKCTAKPCSFLVTDTTLVSDNSLRFRKNLLQGI